MSIRGKRWVTAALLVAVGAWSAPAATMAAGTALRAPAGHGTTAKTAAKHKKKDPYKKPPQLEPKPKDKKNDGKSLAQLNSLKPKKKGDEYKKPPHSLLAAGPKKGKDKKSDGKLLA